MSSSNPYQLSNIIRSVALEKLLHYCTNMFILQCKLCRKNLFQKYSGMLSNSPQRYLMSLPPQERLHNLLNAILYMRETRSIILAVYGLYISSAIFSLFLSHSRRYGSIVNTHYKTQNLLKTNSKTLVTNTNGSYKYTLSLDTQFHTLEQLKTTSVEAVATIIIHHSQGSKASYFWALKICQEIIQQDFVIQ